MSYRTVTMMLLAAALAGTLISACAPPQPPQTVGERRARTESRLVEDGLSEEVAACVVRLADNELRIGELDRLARDELTVSCERAQDVLDGTVNPAARDEDDPADPLAFDDRPHTLGDDPVLDRLWIGCEEGSGAACNQLFEQSPVGSEYELFAVSCGRRDDVLDCVELDDEDQVPDS